MPGPRLDRGEERHSKSQGGIVGGPTPCRLLMPSTDTANWGTAATPRSGPAAKRRRTFPKTYRSGLCFVGGATRPRSGPKSHSQPQLAPRRKRHSKSLSRRGARRPPSVRTTHPAPTSLPAGRPVTCCHCGAAAMAVARGRPVTHRPVGKPTTRDHQRTDCGARGPFGANGPLCILMKIPAESCDEPPEKPGDGSPAEN